MEKNDEDNILDINGVNIYLHKFWKNLDEAKLDDIKNRFQMYKKGRVNKKELLDILESYMIILSDEDLKPLFAKIDNKKQGSINFLEFIQYLTYEIKTHYENKIFLKKKEPLSMPKLLIKEAIEYDKNLPNNIIGIEIIPLTKQPSETLFDHDLYVLINENGGLQFYSPNMTFIKTHQLSEENFSVKSMIVLPDYDVICVALLYRLKFYDPSNFQLRMTVNNVLFTSCLSYVYEKKKRLGLSRLAVGTDKGNVLVLELWPRTAEMNPFYKDAHKLFQPPPPEYEVSDMLDYNPIVRDNSNNSPPFRAIQYADLHPEKVLGVAFSDATGRWFTSVSGSRHRSIAYCRVDHNVHHRTVQYAATTPNGALCVCVAHVGHAATGDRMGRLTLWRVHALAVQAIVSLDGHRTAMRRVFYDPKAAHLISVASDLTVIVWDAVKPSRLATLDVCAGLVDHHAYSAAHFDRTMLALTLAVGDALVVYNCEENFGDQEPEPVASGHSHDAPVLKTMYNALFHVLVSVSAADSMITVWNPSAGRPIVQRPMAHTRRSESDGSIVPVEITAAAFDPSQTLLITGATNGTLKLWSPSDLRQLNKFSIPSRNRISDIIWTPHQLLIMVSNRRATKILVTFELRHVVTWDMKRDEYVLSMCMNSQSNLLVMTTSAGLIVFLYSLSIEKSLRRELGKGVGVAVTSRFLQSRPEAVGVGKLLLATSDGVVQLWCTHVMPVYVAQFVATHEHGDHVTCMSSDVRDRYLFTGFNSGYVKTWHVSAFGHPHPADTVSADTLQLRFPFLQNSPRIGRAERAAAVNVAGPQLVNSYRAHTQRVTHIEYVDKLELLVTSSVDQSIRVWTLAGHFVGMLGTPWSAIPKTGPVHLTQYAAPPDIKCEASYTTLKVLEGTADSTADSETEISD